MAKSLRVQLSLIFSDEDLFDNFITPLKENKELSGLIMKLLKIYYENEEIRNSIEGLSIDSVLGGDEQVIDSTEAINKMRQTLAMQDFLFEQAKQTLEDGASEMDALMRANDIAQQAGVVKTETSESGEVVPKLLLENPISETPTSVPNNTNNNGGLEGRVGRLEENINDLRDLIKQLVASQSFSQQPSVTVSSNSDIDSNYSSLNDVVEVSSVETTKTPVLEEPIVTSPVISQDVTYINEEEDNSVSEQEDASGVLSDVLKDLLG